MQTDPSVLSGSDLVPSPTANGHELIREPLTTENPIAVWATQFAIASSLISHETFKDKGKKVASIGRNQLYLSFGCPQTLYTTEYIIGRRTGWINFEKAPTG